MRHVVVERWSRRGSFLHRRDARTKLLVTLFYLISLGTQIVIPPAILPAYVLLPAAGLAVSGIPVAPFILRTLAVIPFSMTLAAVTWLAGDAQRAVQLMVKSYLSCFAVLLLVGSTPWPELLDGARKLGAPRIFVLVVQFLYRYLFVITEQARNMWNAAACRGSGFRTAGRESRRSAASGALAVLFVRSYERALRIERAMTARAFDGTIHPPRQGRFAASDLAFGVIMTVVLGAMRIWSIV